MDIFHFCTYSAKEESDSILCKEKVIFKVKTYAKVKYPLVGGRFSDKSEISQFSAHYSRCMNCVYATSGVMGKKRRYLSKTGCVLTMSVYSATTIYEEELGVLHQMTIT